MRMSGCPSVRNTPRSSTPRTPCSTRATSAAFCSFRRRSGPTTFTVFSPFTPLIASSTLSAMACEKLKSTPGNASRNFCDSSRWSFSLVTPPRQVAGTFHRAAEQDAPHAPDVLPGLLQADRERERGADPEVAFLELGHELGADEAQERPGCCHRRQREEERRDRAAQREREQRPVGAVQPAQEGVVVRV